jgi:hypothetical protein
MRPRPADRPRQRRAPAYLPLMRMLLPLLLVAGPAQAWEFTPAPVCTLTHATPEASVTVTWDPRQAEPYAIRIDRAEPWPGGPVFAIDYVGGRPLTISTSRHRLGDGGTSLTVTDGGFGNVLDGLEFNETATALLGEARVPFPLAGAAEPVRAFRACTEAPLARIASPGAVTAG